MARINTLSETRAIPPPNVAQPRVWRAAQDFQSLLLTQMVRDMRESNIEADLSEDSIGKSVFDGMFSEGIASKMAESDALRLTDVIYRRLGGAYRAPLSETSGDAGTGESR